MKIIDLPDGKKIVIDEGKAYVVDFKALHDLMTQPMEISVPPPEPEEFLRLRMHTELFIPKISTPSVVLTSIYYGAPATSPWQFAFLFPLGKKGYIKRRK